MRRVPWKLSKLSTKYVTMIGVEKFPENLHPISQHHPGNTTGLAESPQSTPWRGSPIIHGTIRKGMHELDSGVICFDNVGMRGLGSVVQCSQGAEDGGGDDL